MMLQRKLVFVLLSVSFIGSTVHAEIYKCMNNGEVTYQQKPCANADEQKQITIKPAPIVNNKPAIVELPSKRDRLGPVKKQPIKGSRPSFEEQNKRNCEVNREAYEKMAKQIIETCKRRRETYCDESPVEIAQRNDFRAFDKLTKRQNYLYQQRGTEAANIRKLKQQMDDWCREQ